MRAGRFAFPSEGGAADTHKDTVIQNVVPVLVYFHHILRAEIIYTYAQETAPIARRPLVNSKRPREAEPPRGAPLVVS